MAELKCRVENCTYNRDCLCSKGDILVSGKHAENSEDTNCESFVERRDGACTSAIEHPCKTISIDCEAVKCVYNSNYKCAAEHVDISGCGTCGCRKTRCATFAGR